MASEDKPDGVVTVEAHYLKGPGMVTVYADGAYGGATPRGMISLALYNERRPIPVTQELTFDDESQLYQEVTTAGKTGIIRQVDCELFMNPEVALGLGKFLVDRATEVLNSRQGDADE